MALCNISFAIFNSLSSFSSPEEEELELEEEEEVVVEEEEDDFDDVDDVIGDLSL